MNFQNSQKHMLAALSIISVILMMLVVQGEGLKIINQTHDQVKIYDVAIIGAGSAGIAASLTLTKHNVEHLLLQSRDRIGGRVVSSEFEKVRIDLGATFIHNPNDNNQIFSMVQTLNLNTTSANYDNEIYYYSKQEELQDQVVEKADSFYELLEDSIDELNQNTDKDISLQDAARPWLQNQSKELSPDVFDVVQWKLQMEANLDGTELDFISTRDWTKGESQQDLIPTEGYASLLNAIFNQCRPELRLKERVSRIDYSGDIVNIYTSKSIYSAKKVISSLPLGILKQKLVQFKPDLPSRNRQSIQNIGNGIFNKLFVSFDTPFWSEDQTWLNFITSRPSRYPVAINLSKKQKYILCFFISGSSNQLSSWPTNKIKTDLINFLNQFNVKTPIQIKNIKTTQWHRERDSMGSYSFLKVGTTKQDFQFIKQPIDNKLWMVGEHCNPNGYAYVHSAYQTGRQAAEQIIISLQK